MDNVDFSLFMKEIQPNESRSHLHDHIIRLGTGAKEQVGKKKPKNENDKFKEMVRKIKKNRKTLHLIVIDEAHFGISDESEFNIFFNQTNFDNIFENVITLQVSATPYSMLTQYSRIPESNVINWFDNGENEGDYYGIQSYYRTATTEPHRLDNNQLKPGALVVDNEYESMVDSSSHRWKSISKLSHI